jgi:hypothetical protein
MLPRSLSHAEQRSAVALNCLGLISGWEWLAAFDSNRTELLTFRTDRDPRRTNWDQELLDHWAAGGRCIVHHNHPSGESLSDADWLALVRYPLDEIFAHAEDGSIFYGRLLDAAAAPAALANWVAATNAADAAFMAALTGVPDVLTITEQLSKHLVGEALSTRGVALYAHELGPGWLALLGAYPAAIRAGIAAATAAL